MSNDGASELQADSAIRESVQLSPRMRFTPMQHVIVASKGGVMVLVDALAGEYFTLNETGSRIWELAAQRFDTTTIIQQLTGEFDVTATDATADVTTLLADLVSRGLMQTVSDNGSLA